MPTTLKIDNRRLSNNLTITICVPVYNVERYLTDCLDSLLAQDYPNMQIILVDDGSTDSSGTICDEYALAHPQIIVVDHQQNKGPLMARRKGFSLAKGEYVMCVDSDDMLLPGAVSLIANTIEQTGADVVRFKATRSLDGGSANNPASNVNPQCVFIGAEEKQSFLKKLCQSTDGSQNAMWAKATRTSCVGMDMDLSSFSGLTFAEDLLQTVIIYDCAYTIAELDAIAYYYRPESGITHTYAPHMYYDVCRCLDFAEGFARKWEDEYECDGLLAGLAACRLDSASQLAEYLAERHNKDELKKLVSSSDFSRCINTPNAFSFLSLGRRVELWALMRGFYSFLALPMFAKEVLRGGLRRLA